MEAPHEDDEVDVEDASSPLLDKTRTSIAPSVPAVPAGWRERVSAALYGATLGAHAAELPRIAWLAAVLFCIIGSFWLLDSLKDTVFATLVGLEHQPLAKILSVGTTLALVLYYNSLLDRVATPTVRAALPTGAQFLPPLSLKL